MESNPAENADFKVLVIGAGVTGLLIAHGLQKAGIQVSVFEREASSQAYRPREWTMGIHWGLPLMESLLPDKMRASLARETYTDPNLDWEKSPCNHMRMFNGLTGETIKDVPVQGKIVRVSRRKLRAFLSQGIDVQVRNLLWLGDIRLYLCKYDRQLIDIKYETNGVIAEFANGIEAKGNLIVGCDGPQSAVRTLLLGPDEATAQPLTDVVHCNTNYIVGDADKARFLRSSHPAWAVCMHPELFCMTALVGAADYEKPETWQMQVITGWLGDREAFPDAAERLAEVKRRGAKLCEPFRSATQWIPEGHPVTFDVLRYWVSVPWNTRGGLATLAGDAAHPMGPHRGQGMNHAIQDAYNLVSFLTASRSDISEHPESAQLANDIQSYSDEVARRGAEEVKLTTQSAYMSLSWKSLPESPIIKHALDRSPQVNGTPDRALNTDEGYVRA
ncbi:hypothetical protein AAFC00_000237 [Neodothiora populina]|uniref:FAD-binding domain-containing protein n=1 Tax=Neodothiora populina TaxID=2781224 RepID=A0ABR3P1V6_9PEZI